MSFSFLYYYVTYIYSSEPSLYVIYFVVYHMKNRYKVWRNMEGIQHKRIKVFTTLEKLFVWIVYVAE